MLSEEMVAVAKVKDKHVALLPVARRARRRGYFVRVTSTVRDNRPALGLPMKSV